MITFTDLGLFSYLGNELFQYAALLGVAERRGFEVRLPPARQYSMGRLIEVDSPTYTTEELRSLRYHFGQVYPSFGYCPDLETIPDWCDVNGYFQDRRHFPDRPRDLLRIRPEVLRSVEDMWSRLAPSRPVVGFHLRRGDIVGSQARLQLSESTGYMRQAKAQFEALGDVQFLLVSDDLAWCEANLAGPDTSVAEPASAAEHLALLARCDHLIIGNSTFSWWAAWFQEPRGGVVVAPKEWYPAGTFPNDELDLPSSWVLL